MKLNPDSRKFNRLLQNKSMHCAWSPKDQQGHGIVEAPRWRQCCVSVFRNGNIPCEMQR